MTHAVIEAAAQFQSDERGRKRKRMTAEQRRDLERTLNAMNVQRHDPIDWARRGEAAVDFFDYTDTFDEKAKTVIADILWAAQAHGFMPVEILQGSWSEYLADRARAEEDSRRGA